MSPSGAGGQLRARCSAAFFGGVVTITDLVPPHFRYGYVHRLTRRMFRRPLPVLPALDSGAVTSSSSSTVSASATMTCALLTGSMDVGGIGSVVEMLASALDSTGIRPIVVCTVDGARAARLRSRGVEVVVVGEATAERRLIDLAPDVMELHGAPEFVEAAALATGIPLVPVFHNTEIHYSPARWRRLARLLEGSVAAIAVSDLVGSFHARHLPSSVVDRIRVVPNASSPQEPPSDHERAAARRSLSAVLQTALGDDVVVVSLARYDSQKNVAGLVASFLSTVTDPRIRLVVAGDPSDWAEVRRADAIRRSAAGGDRVSLLAASDARALLAAADAFVLDSFFEGWPVAATEAAALGLPLVLSDFGGARELVQRDPAHSVLIGNPSGVADSVSDAAVARGRRRSRRQVNAPDLGAAIDRVAGSVRSGDRPTPADTDALMDAMMEGHAAVLRRASAGAADDGTARSERTKRGTQ